MVDHQSVVQPRQQLIAGAQTELASAHLLLIARLLRSSARHDFATLPPHQPLQRRILLALDRRGPCRVTELARHLGNDLGQVSRALQALDGEKMVVRSDPRGPYALASLGRRLAARLDLVARARDEQLRADFQPGELFELAAMLLAMQTRANDVLVLQQAGCNGQTTGEAGAPVGTLRAPVDLPDRLHPAVISLAVTISRSASLSFKRLIGLSNSAWRVLAIAASRPGLTIQELVEHAACDHGQVSRSLDALAVQGLIERQASGRGAPTQIWLTAEGEAAHAIMLADALQRQDQILIDFREAQRQRLMVYLQRLIVNASAMVDRATKAAILPHVSDRTPPSGSRAAAARS